MATTTFSGPVKAGPVREGAGTNTGFVSMAQSAAVTEVNAFGTTDIIIPANSQITNVYVLVTTAFDNGTNTIDVGISSDTDLFVDGLGSGASGVTTTGADATVYLAKTVTVPADTTLVVLDTPIYLMEADVLKGGASANSDLDLFVSYEVLDDA